MRRLHTRVHASACALLFLRLELSDAVASLVNHGVRLGVSLVLDFVESQAHSIRWRLQADANIFKSPEAKPTAWKHPLYYLQMWVSASAKAAIVRQLIYRTVVLNVQQLAQQVEKHTPKFEHFLNDKAFGGGGGSSANICCIARTATAWGRSPLTSFMASHNSVHSTAPPIAT